LNKRCSLGRGDTNTLGEGLQGRGNDSKQGGDCPNETVRESTQKREMRLQENLKEGAGVASTRKGGERGKNRVEEKTTQRGGANHLVLERANNCGEKQGQRRKTNGS